MQLANNFTVNGAKCASSVAFIGIDVHSKCEVGVYAANNVIKDEGTSGVKANLNDLLVNNTDLFCVCGSHVDVSLSDDNAVLKLYLTLRSYDFAAAAAFKVTAFTDRSLYTDASCITC
jgi:hypothetical protein